MAIPKIFQTFLVSSRGNPSNKWKNSDDNSNSSSDSNNASMLDYKKQNDNDIQEIALDRDLSKIIYVVNRLIDTPLGTAVTFANLTIAPTHGMLVPVTDSTTTTWGAVITGGGANKVLAFFNGSFWTVAAK